MKFALISMFLLACGKVGSDSQPPPSDAGGSTSPDAAGVRIPDGGLGPAVDPAAKVAACETGVYGGGTNGFADPTGEEALFAALENTRCPNRDGVKGRPAASDCHEFGRAPASDPWTYYSCGAPIVCPRVADSSCIGSAYECIPADETSARAASPSQCQITGSRICCP